MSGVVVVGVQWGDEGKGKIIDVLSSEADVVVRCQGGDNAGHTVIAEGKEYKFHLIPSGILYPDTLCYITGGTVLNPVSLIKEIEQVNPGKRLKISPFAHLILPYHRQLDALYEELKGEWAIGTTKRGIGPCYADKANRLGIQIGDLLDFSVFSKKLRQVVSLKNQELEGLFKKPPLNVEEIEEEFREYAKKLSPYIDEEVEKEVAIALKEGKKVLFEGAHGSYLDSTFGTYPYVTSSNTIAAGVLAGAGIGPTRVQHVLGIVKAYTTRVGNGPLPTTLETEEEGLFLQAETAREIATTTGRERRIGWFDAPLARHALSLSGATSMAVTKLDVLDTLPVIKVCTGYMLDGKEIKSPPYGADKWERLSPIYEELPGWQQDTTKSSSYDDLPKEAKAYLQRIESLCEVPISYISYGPEREKTLQLSAIF